MFSPNVVMQTNAVPRVLYVTSLKTRGKARFS